MRTAQWTAGHEQAWRELLAISRATSGKVSVAPDTAFKGDYLLVTLLVDCVGTRYASPGVRLADTEVFTIHVPQNFPSSPPWVFSTNARFARQPHVMWEKNICLHASQNDWEPTRGMWDVVHRLLTWMSRVSQGTLVNPALPLHPPVVQAVTLSDVDPIVVRPDLPAIYERDRGLWTCWALLEPEQGSRHYELTAWLTNPTDGGRRHGTGALLALVIGLPEPMNFLYPRTEGELAAVIKAQGLPHEDFNRLVSTAQHINRQGDPVVLMVGSPAPGNAVITARVAQLAAWQLRLPTRMDQPYTGWVHVYDHRQTRTVRRDVTRPVTWLRGKRVLILGCGALGAPIAEYCIRAGADGLDLVDNGSVSPGILVRQPYDHRQIGSPKADATMQRLLHVNPNADIRAHHKHAPRLSRDVLDTAQLIVDATANRSVAAWLEYTWRDERRLEVPIVSVMVGHDTHLGVATVAMPGGSGAGVDVLRQLALAAFDADDINDMIDDFYPDPPRTSVFQPEPGCSDPTFVGSAADLAALSARLFNAAIGFVATADATAAQPYVPTRAAAVVRHSTVFGPERPSQFLQWTNDLVFADKAGYEIRIAPSALVSMRQEAIRATQLDAGGREAGGILLGEIDPACQVVWVSDALGQTPGGQASAGGITMNPERIRADVLGETSRTRGMRAFIGAWHSHPCGDAKPSETDHTTMNNLVNGKGSLMPTAVLLIVGGREHWPRWLAGTGRPDIHVQTFLANPAGPIPPEPRRAHDG